MKNKIATLLALMLCMGAFLLPMTAYASAAEDTTPPTLSARLDGDILRAEASDSHSGVEAVYVNGHRFGYLVDGALEVSPLRDYAGKGETITVQAVDYAGNKSKTVSIQNPYYTVSASAPKQTQTTPAPDPTPQPTTAATPQSTAAPSAGDTATSESALPNSSAPFTPDGTGTVQDNATEQDGKEFFTIVTEDENVFYLVIDRQRDSENVYLLNAVTEDDLMALAEKDKSSGESAVPTPEPVQTTPEPDAEQEPQPEPEPAAENNTGSIVFVVIAALAFGAAGYYFKILKPKRDAAMNDEDMEEDEDTDEADDYGDENNGFADVPEDFEDEEYSFTEDPDEDGGIQ